MVVAATPAITASEFIVIAFSPTSARRRFALAIALASVNRTCFAMQDTIPQVPKQVRPALSTMNSVLFTIIIKEDHNYPCSQERHRSKTTVNICLLLEHFVSMDHFKEAEDFVSRVKGDKYLEPNLFREQEEFSLFRKMVEKEEYGDMSGRLSGEMKAWDIELNYAMSEESDEEVAIKQQVAEQMGLRSIETGLDTTFFIKRSNCMKWWDQQSFDLKRRCLERVITLLGKEKIDHAATQKYKSICDGIAWQNNHALKEACKIIEKLSIPLRAGVAGAEVVVLRIEKDRLSKELLQKKNLLKKKNKELKTLREREAALVRQLGLS